MTSLIQLGNSVGKRLVAMVDGDVLRLLQGALSVYDLCQQALGTSGSLIDLAHTSVGKDSICISGALKGAHLIPE